MDILVSQLATATTSRPQTYYPSQLTTYLQCPERYLHRHVERRRVEEPFSPTLARGSAAHDALAEILETRRLGGTYPDGNGLRRVVASHLPRGPYPSEITWETDVEGVCRQVEFALTTLGPSARILLVERTVTYNAIGRASGPGTPDAFPFTLRARLDLLAETRANPGAEPHDADAVTLVAYDWKSGGRVDYLQSACAYLGVRRAYPGVPIRVVTVLMGERRIHIDDWERDALRAAFRTIRRTIASIRAEEHWTPEPSNLCSYCAYDGNGCSLTGGNPRCRRGRGLGQRGRRGRGARRARLTGRTGSGAGGASTRAPRPLCAASGSTPGGRARFTVSKLLHTCIHCGQPFRASRHAQRACGRVCATLHRAPRRPTPLRHRAEVVLTCPWCGRQVTRPASRRLPTYCSVSCAARARWADPAFRVRSSRWTRALSARQRAVASARMVALNRDPAILARSAATKRGRAFAGQRGGNGTTTIEQETLARALGWPTERAIATGDPAWPCAIVDIAHPTLPIAVEVDGASHHTARQRARDVRKAVLLARVGWLILRVWNAEVRGDLAGVVAAIRHVERACSVAAGSDGAAS